MKKTACWTIMSCAIVHTAIAWASDIPESHREVRGLGSAAEVLIDRWGVPHIYASTVRDAFFVQGWNAARDRLWQIDLWRRSGLGELADAFGPSYLEQDRAIRSFVYRGDMEKEWAAYGPSAKRDAQAFVEGINAYVEAVKNKEIALPMEFRLAGYEPGFWKTDDIVRVRNRGIAGLASSQLGRARMLCKTKSTVAMDLLMPISPPWSMVTPRGLDLCGIPSNVLDKYNLALKPIRKVDKPSGASAVTALSKAVSEEWFDAPELSLQGSNNWVVASERTRSGRPLLANDPHRSLDIPSLRYVSHLSAPGLNVIGAGEPALPGITVGHNGNVAFGLTIFFVAQEDLYVYETNPANPEQYRFRNRWESMRIHDEAISVRGSPEASVRLKFTRHGPVVFEDPKHNRAYAVRATWLETGGAPYMGALRYLRAKNVRQFKSALQHWGTPGENMVYADATGAIGWSAVGLVPMRPNSDGLLPLPGDGRYEWQGYLDSKLLPSELNPPRGFIATANQMTLPQGYPYQKRRIGFLWADDIRFTRISQVLESSKSLTVEDSEALQNDYSSLAAQRLVSLLRAMDVRDAALKELVDWFAQWDGRVTASSAQAALFEIWGSRHLVADVMKRVAPDFDATEPRSAVPIAVIDLLENPDSRLGSHPEQVRDELMLHSLASAEAEAKRLLGSDRSSWRWGRLSQILFEHPLAGFARDANTMNVGGEAKSGDAGVVGLAVYDPHNFRTQLGASFRMTLDIGEWDRSRAINTPGQSGDPESPHYRDLFPLWLKDESFPLLYSRASVEQMATQRITLTPVRDP